MERLKLEGENSWRDVRDGELKPGDEILPCVVLYSRKRCGRYKARLVALGNLQKAFSASEIYSPTVSHAANRVLLVEAAAAGHFVEQFDITN